MAITDTGEIIIHEGNWQQFVNPVIDGEVKRCGTIPRNMMTHPPGFYSWATPVDFPLYPQADWEKIIADKQAAKAELRDVIMKGGPDGGVLPARDQNGRGYCWQHSGVSAMMVWRAVMNLPYADLSAYGPACRDKDFADEGGWGAAGVDNLIKWGCPTSKTWPQQGVQKSYDNAATWAEAANYKISDQWADISAAQYDRNMAFGQFVTLNLSGRPTVDDYNWWSHSVCGLDAVSGKSYRNKTRSLSSGKLLQLAEFDKVWSMNHPVTAGIARRIFNSWGISWSDKGTGLLTGNQAIPNGGVGIKNVSLYP